MIIDDKWLIFLLIGQINFIALPSLFTFIRRSHTDSHAENLNHRLVEMFIIYTNISQCQKGRLINHFHTCIYDMDLWQKNEQAKKQANK